MVNRNNCAYNGLRVAWVGDQFSSFLARILHDLGADVVQVTDDVETTTSDRYVRHYQVAIPCYKSKDLRGDLRDKDLIINACREGEGWPVLNLKAMQTLQADNPRQIICTITPYGMTGPWAGRPASDLTLLAAGGFLGSCGYDDGKAAGLPIGCSGGQSNHIAGMVAAIAVQAALKQLENSPQAAGRRLDISVQHALSVSTEMSIPYWDYTHADALRHTGRHAMPRETPRWQHQAADGQYFLALPLYIDDKRFAMIKQWLDDEGIPHNLEDEKFQNADSREEHMFEIVDIFRDLVETHNTGWLFTESQRRRMPWAPINRADQCIEDSHFARYRQTVEEIGSVRRARLPFLITSAAEV
ncbi:CoA transferase [Salinisphaera hydrothermalis]|uniref:CoA transferase n=1 Tax=Salinisphaera hydrothermalis TaxID=563188 RepID=UPI000A01C637|nr:CoA transferase [Salinisphaera hydrothermalis]